MFHKQPVKQKLTLSCNFTCYQIRNNCWYAFGHTLVGNLNPTWMFNKPASEDYRAEHQKVSFVGNYKDILFISLQCQRPKEKFYNTDT